MTTNKDMSADDAIGELVETLGVFRAQSEEVDAVAEVLIAALRQGRKVLTCGNGGSAADALHLSEELLGRYKHDRRALPAVSLAADGTLLTCICNDYGYENVFSRQVEGLGQAGDVLVLFSTSGNSENLLRALKAARTQQLVTIALLGKDGGRIKTLADYEIVVPSRVTARIQEIHTLILHSWLEKIDSAFR